MSTVKLSMGYVKIGQVGILIFFIPLIGFLTYGIVTKNLTVNGLSFLFAFILAVTLFIWNALSYSDLYISNDLIVAKKLFSTQCIQRSEVQQVTKALRPFTYRIKLIDGRKIIFMCSISDFFKQLLSSNPDLTLTAIKKRIAKDN